MEHLPRPRPDRPTEPRNRPTVSLPRRMAEEDSNRTEEAAAASLTRELKVTDFSSSRPSKAGQGLCERL